MHMSPSWKLPTWAPRVKPQLIRRLYENDAQGFCDEQLLDEVGWALYSRCKSFVTAMESSQGRTRCPQCNEVVFHTLRANEILQCRVCGWECPYKEVRKTIQNQQLNGGPEVVALFQEYMDRFPKAQESTQKMMIIDMLIHGFHHFIRSGRTRRPVGVNLIDVHLEFVIHFLDELTYGPQSTPGLQQNQAVWRKNMSSSRQGKIK